MTTRAKAGIFKPRHQLDLAHTSSHALYSTLFAQKDPKGFKSAAKNPKWMLAMHEEMIALQQNDTWVLVPFFYWLWTSGVVHESKFMGPAETLEAIEVCGHNAGTTKISQGIGLS
uniref:Uncharacterized protein n=1 Tax=Lactuca sativa TaxID=4236 RepID=A0A9R1UHT8_LACSA|nr:hypothetical protein LSAT_V11C900504720 [Lactuca sativa]